MSQGKKFIVKDSGERETFRGGAVRDTAAGKPRPDLISPFMLERLGAHMAKGAKKYTEWNWANGIPSSRCYESACRHMMMFAQGDRVEDHLSAAMFNLMVMIHNEEVEKREVSYAASPKHRRADMPIFVEKSTDRCPSCGTPDPILRLIEKTTTDNRSNASTAYSSAFKCRECGCEWEIEEEKAK